MESQAADPLAESQAVEPLGESQAAEPLRESQAAEPLRESQAAEPRDESQAAKPRGQNMSLSSFTVHWDGTTTPDANNVAFRVLKPNLFKQLSTDTERQRTEKRDSIKTCMKVCVGGPCGRFVMTTREVKQGQHMGVYPGPAEDYGDAHEGYIANPERKYLCTIKNDCYGEKFDTVIDAAKVVRDWKDPLHVCAFINTVCTEFKQEANVEMEQIDSVVVFTALKDIGKNEVTWIYYGEEMTGNQVCKCWWCIQKEKKKKEDAREKERKEKKAKEKPRKRKKPLHAASPSDDMGTSSRKGNRK